MSRFIFRLFPLVFLLFTVACSQGFDRGLVQRELAATPLQVNDPGVKAAMNLKGQLHFPFRMAIALTSSPQRYGKKWRWDAKDKELVENWGYEMQRAGVVKDAFVMSDMFIEGSELVNYRQAAAKHGADAVLVISGASDIDKYLNPSAILYISIVGAMFIPGTHRDALFVAQGGLLDVGNGYLYASVEAEAENTTIRPAFFSSDAEATDPAKKEALGKFTRDLGTRLRNLR